MSVEDFHDLPAPDDEPVAVEEPRPPSPILEAIRAEREKAAEKHIYDLEVPGYGGLLMIRCGPVGGRQAGVLRERFTESKSPDRDFNLNADTILAACREVLGRQAIDAPLEPLDDEVPVLIDYRLAELLRLPVDVPPGGKPTGRQVLRALFSAAHDPDLAVGVAGGQFMEWASSANEQVSEEALGES